MAGESSLHPNEARVCLWMYFEYQEKGYFLIHEFVVMPDHFHLILTPAEGILLEKAMRYIKGGFWFRGFSLFVGARGDEIGASSKADQALKRRNFWVRFPRP
jgi:REP element-mobilizing transposase RayT